MMQLIRMYKRAMTIERGAWEGFFLKLMGSTYKMVRWCTGVRGDSIYRVLKDSPQPQVPLALGLVKTNSDLSFEVM